MSLVAQSGDIFEASIWQAINEIFREESTSSGLNAAMGSKNCGEHSEVKAALEPQEKERSGSSRLHPRPAAASVSLQLRNR